MSDEFDDHPTLTNRISSWFDKLLKDPIGTLIESGIYIFLLGIGVSIAAMFVKMGWNMIRRTWE
jgi:hypothetical protein